MDDVARFSIGQAVYITNRAHDFAWPALIGDLIPPNYVQLVFNNNESALVEARYVAAMPEVTMANFDKRIEPLPDAFFDTSHRNPNTAPTQVPTFGTVNELVENPSEYAREQAATALEVEEECSDAPMLTVQEQQQQKEQDRVPAYAQVTIMNQPRPKQKLSHRRRLSSKLTLRNRYHQRIEPEKRCCCLIQ